MRILITGATGQLGPYIARRLRQDGHELVLWSQAWTQTIEGIVPQCVDLQRNDDVTQAFTRAAPQAVVHCAAMSQIAACHADPRKAERVNVIATEWLATLADRAGISLIYLSTDLVFDGDKGDYREEDPARPTSTYGRTKLEGESRVLASPLHTVLRLPLILSPSLNGRPKFYDQLVASLKERKPITLFDDEWRTPLGAEEAAEAIALVLKHRVTGLFHLAGPVRLSRYEMGVRIAAELGLDASCIVRASRLSVKSAEPRPRDTSLNGTKWVTLDKAR